jgi:hypothetical protein
MSTLVIHAPKTKTYENGSRSFEETLRLSVGEEYAIPHDVASQIPGWAVVVLSKDAKLRAEGKLVRLTPCGKTQTGMQRYIVGMKNLKRVPYKPERLGRTGIAIF